MSYHKFDKLKQRTAERRALENIRPVGKIQGVDPVDRHHMSGIIPVPESVYAPAGGVRKLRKSLLHPGDTGLLKGDDA